MLTYCGKYFISMTPCDCDLHEEECLLSVLDNKHSYQYLRDKFIFIGQHQEKIISSKIMLFILDHSRVEKYVLYNVDHIYGLLKNHLKDSIFLNSYWK